LRGNTGARVGETHWERLNLTGSKTPDEPNRMSSSHDPGGGISSKSEEISPHFRFLGEGGKKRFSVDRKSGGKTNTDHRGEQKCEPYGNWRGKKKKRGPPTVGKTGGQTEKNT